MIGQSALVTGVRPAAPPRPTPALKSLGWVRGLLPVKEGTAWWAEVTSCVAEASDPGERRRYLRSYRQSIPQLVWTSWTSEVRSVQPALAGVEYRNVERK